MSTETKFKNLDKRKYADIRNEIKEGDIFFCSGNYTVSKIIRHLTNSHFSHVGIVLFWDDRVMLAESVEDDGVRVVPLSQYVNDYENSREKYDGQLYLSRMTDVNLSYENIEKIKTKIFPLLNRNYDKDSFTKIFLRLTLHLTKNIEDDEFICSELTDELFQSINIRFNRDHNYIFPEQIGMDERVKPLYEII